MPENPTIDTVHGYIGFGLSRPECAVAHQSGLIIVPNWTANGGVSVISPSNKTCSILSTGSHLIKPNGIALEPNGSILLAHMGELTGGIYRLFADGSTEEVVMRINGRTMPPANFVVLDSYQRLWITVSTRKTPRARDYRSGANSGFIAVAQPGATNATIVADNLGYTNECVIDETHGHVYVNETFGRRMTRFDLSGSKQVSLSNRRTLCQFGAGTYPDGLALDSEGGLWITSIVSNRIIRAQADGSYHIKFEDSDTAHIQWTEDAFKNDSLGREHLDTAQSKNMKNISNIAFGGADLNRLYLGNLLGSKLPYLDVDVSGAKMVHWDVPLGPLSGFL